MPLSLLATTQAGWAAGPYQKLNFSIFTKPDKKVFLIGFFDVILDDVIYGDGTAPLPRAISLENEAFGEGPVVILPDQASRSSDAAAPSVTWSGPASQPGGSGSGGTVAEASGAGGSGPSTAGRSGAFSITSNLFLRAVNPPGGTVPGTWRSLVGQPFEIQGDGSVSVALQPVTIQQPGPLLLEFSLQPVEGSSGSVTDQPSGDGDAASVPAPVPLFGLGAALAVSRRIRQRRNR
ncbi:MAG: hypothetical protein ER33_11005 [Cyanobium sp. CACIAM 14]|nr:MAG: hypothetical protein ER33_11005 [Cyanobium sp. CACIAM 14]